MLHAIWRGGSLRAWIALGMVTAVLPLATAAVAGYLILSRGVLASFQDVAARQRDQIDPTQQLRLALVEAATPLDAFVDEGDPRQPLTYRTLREGVETRFAAILDHTPSGSEVRALVERARVDWTAADRLATEALSVRRAPGDPHGAALMDGFHGLINSAVDKLGAVYDELASELRADHDEALRDVERSRWLATVAAAVAALTILAGVTLIGRVITGSVEQLVSGAERFAAGDRDYRIDVRVPPELHRVAEEFNRMIGRIHESEAALEDLARRDGLTQLLNRRAFDEELLEMVAQQQRVGVPFALLMLDLDHFKRINDVYGHPVGDDVLRAAARSLVSELRPFDRLFRIGGEEFAVILTGADRGEARIAAERLRQAVATHPISVNGTLIEMTVSIGVAVATVDSGPDTLTRAADTALYRAKTAGRDRVFVLDGVGDSPAAS